MFKNIVLIVSLIFFSNCANIIAYDLSKPINNVEISNEQIEGVTLFYYTAGDKENPPLVFLHGVLAFTGAYKKLITSLSEKYFVIGVDLPGHGKSTVGRKHLNSDQLADYIIHLTDKIDIGKFYIVGHSAGGVVALTASKNYPEKIIKAATVASLFNIKGLNFDSKRYKFLSENGFKEYDQGKTDFVLKIFNISHRMMGEGIKFDSTKQVMAEQGRRLYPSYTITDLKGINTPFLIIVAKEDNLVIPDHSISMANYLLNSQLIVVDGANHASIVRNRKNVKKITRSIFKFFNEEV